MEYNFNLTNKYVTSDIINDSQFKTYLSHQFLTQLDRDTEGGKEDQKSKGSFRRRDAA